MVRRHDENLRTSLPQCGPQGAGDRRSDAEGGSFSGVVSRWIRGEMEMAVGILLKNRERPWKFCLENRQQREDCGW